MNLLLIATCAAAIMAPAVCAQTFDVASIRLNQSGSGGSGLNRHQGRLNADNLNLKALMEFAFDVNSDQIIGGARWLETEKYDIAAKADSSVDTDEQFRLLLRALLADRFQLKFHRDTAQISLYSLVIAKNGAKLTEHTGEGGPSTRLSSGAGKTTITALKAPAVRIAEVLSQALGRTVVDNTGLKGEYDFRLEWSPEQVADSPLPSIFTALQEQAGLRLESTKGPVDVIAIDHAERPSGN